MKALLTSLLLLLLIPLEGQAQLYPNRPVPSEINPYQYTILDSTFSGHMMLGCFRLSEPTFQPYMMLLDEEGYLLWYHSEPYKYIFGFDFVESHGMFTFLARYLGTTHWYTTMDQNFNPVDSLETVNGVWGDVHEFQWLDDGHYLLSGVRDTVMDLSGETFNGQQGSASTTVRSFVVQEFDAIGNFIWEWKSIDHIAPTEVVQGYTYNPSSFDYAHGNSIDEDYDGNLLISFRHLNAVHKINRSTGQIMWRLGGALSDFTFDAPSSAFSGQHDARRLPDGNLSLFDNAYQYAPLQSRGMIFSLDTVNMVASLVEEYKASPPFQAEATGNFQVGDDDYVTINWGYAFRPEPNVSIMHKNGTDAAFLSFVDSIVTYRASRREIPITFPRPMVSCDSSAGQITLTAPFGYSSYEWSTGETTQSIVVSTTDTFQVWVNHGIGMLGSEPFIITDLSLPCPSLVGIDEPQNTSSKHIVTIYDLSGRAVPRATGNQLYLVHYSNGEAKLTPAHLLPAKWR